MLRERGEIDELGVLDKVQSLFYSNVTGDLFAAKGFSPDSVVPPTGAFDDKQEKGSAAEAADAPAAEAPLQAIPPEQLSPKDRMEYDLWQKYTAQGFNFAASTRNGHVMASRFDREFKKSEKIYKEIGHDDEGAKLYKEYSAHKGNDAVLAEYRKNWAKGKYDAFRTERLFKKDFSKTTFTSGTYMPLGRMAHKEGNGKSGWLQATRRHYRSPARAPALEPVSP